jgi:hypothetical protein
MFRPIKSRTFRCDLVVKNRLHMEVSWVVDL